MKIIIQILCALIPVKSWKRKVRTSMLKKNKNSTMRDINYLLFLKFWPDIMEPEETLKYIIDNKVSMGRFGDGELSLIMGKSIRFQDYNDSLKNDLVNVLNKKDYKFLPCIIGNANSKYPFEEYTKDFLQDNTAKILPFFHNDKIIYGEAGVTRYSLNKMGVDKSICLWKNVWKDKKVLFVYGKGSRFFINETLFGNIKSYDLLETKAVNAYSEINSIIEKVKEYNKNTLILLALGPTATILSYKLSVEGYQALDIGHLSYCLNMYRDGLKSAETTKLFDENRSVK